MLSVELERLIDDELRWREAELALLKIQLLRDIRNVEHFPVSYRSFITISYAHYEAFVKIIFAQAVSEIFQSNTLPSCCVEPIQTYYIANQVRKRVLKLSNAELVKTLLLPNELLDNTVRPNGDELLEISNMNIQKFLDVTGSLGITISTFSNFRRSIGRLVDLRHRCAHGEKLTFDSSKTNTELAQEVFDLQANILLLMHATALELLDTLASKRFLTSP